MSKSKGATLAACIMILLAGVLYATVIFRPELVKVILMIFAVPGYIVAGIALYVWIMRPEDEATKMTVRNLLDRR